MNLLKLKSLQEGRPYQLLIPSQFLETFLSSSFLEQHLLCELYLHNMACFGDSSSNPIPYAVDVQLRAFASFVNNHVQWEDAFQTISRNEASANLWIRSEPQSPRALIINHGRCFLSPPKTQHLKKMQEKVISTCVDLISKQQHLALEGSKHRW
jgi:hypothetical protein